MGAIPDCVTGQRPWRANADEKILGKLAQIVTEPDEEKADHDRQRARQLPRLTERGAKCQHLDHGQECHHQEHDDVIGATREVQAESPRRNGRQHEQQHAQAARHQRQQPNAQRLGGPAIHFARRVPMGGHRVRQALIIRGRHQGHHGHQCQGKNVDSRDPHESCSPAGLSRPVNRIRASSTTDALRV